MPETALSAVRLSHTYGSGPAAVPALRDVTLDFARGTVNLLSGPSGSGKTTLLAVLGCLLTPDAGEVRLFGRPVAATTDTERADLRRRHIGYVFQAFRLFHALTALENVLVALDIAGRRGRPAREAARAALAAVGLADRAGRRPKELSGGEKQRVAIARALVNDPPIVLADEPTASLDAANGAQVADILCRLASEQGRLVVVVTHDPRLTPHATRTVSLEHGRVIHSEEVVS